MTLDDLCLRIDNLIHHLTQKTEERDRYRDALLRVICQGDAVARSIARSALDADPATHSRRRHPQPRPDLKGRR